MKTLRSWIRTSSSEAVALFSKGKGALAGENAFALFAASSIVYSGASLISGLVVLRWIPPTTMGVWQALLVAQAYLQVLRLGVLNGLNRELPYLLGRGERQSALAAASSALAFGTITSALGSLGFGAAMLLLWDRGTVWRLGLAAMAVATLMGFYQSYVQATCRSSLEFRRLAVLQFGQAALMITAPLAVFIWGFAGLAWQYVAQGVATAIWAHAIRPIRVRPHLHWPALKALLSTGLPLFAASYLFTVALGFDRVILFAIGGATAVGLYTPAAWVLSAMTVAPAALSAYVYPKMSFQFGQTQDPTTLWMITRRATLTSLVLTFPLVVGGWLVIPWLVRIGFPAYVPAMPAIRLSLLSAWLFMGPLPGTAVLRSLRAWGLLIAYAAAFVTARAVFPWYFSRQGDPITGVAIGCTIASGVASMVGMWACYVATHRRGIPVPPHATTAQVRERHVHRA